MDDKPIVDPPVPYIGRIKGLKFNPGKIVKIQGLAPGIAYRFDINLQCGPKLEDDVALQISVRLLDGYISLNSLQRGIWGEEQIERLPLARNEKFEIAVECVLNQYQVSINGEHHSDFPQRINHSRISYLAIDGDISISKVSYQSNDIGMASSSVVPNASAPLLTPSPDNNGRNDFQFIDESNNRPPREVIDSSEPPSYEAAVDAAIRPPYPTGNSMGMPHPKIGSGAPYPTIGSGAPYPLNNSGALYPTSGPAIVPLNSPGVHALPGTPVTESYAYQRARKLRWRHRGYLVIGLLVFGGSVTILVLVCQALIHYLASL